MGFPAMHGCREIYIYSPGDESDPEPMPEDDSQKTQAYILENVQPPPMFMSEQVRYWMARHGPR